LPFHERQHPSISSILTAIFCILYKDIPFNFSDFDKNILVAYNFSSENSNNTSIWCYFLNVGKVIWSKDINLKNAILLPLDPHSNFIYFVGINGESVSLYKLNKLDGQIVSNYDLLKFMALKIQKQVGFFHQF